MEAQVNEEPGTPGVLPDLPLLGFRNYWYPLIESRRVGWRPVSVRVLGEDLVLFRAGDRVAALVDRCPHRGTMLSRGRVIFPGTLSCGYHGWTFNAQGECVAAIVEGPESRLPGQVRVRSYSTEERFGVVWAFIGEGEPPRLEEDLPPEANDPNMMPQVTFWNWTCDWRNVTENYPDLLHACLVHRTSWRMFFSPIPVCGGILLKPLSDNNGLQVRVTYGGIQANYPGLGKFPRHYWWRRKWWRRRAKSSYNWEGGLGVIMPGYAVVRQGKLKTSLQWPVPVDENHTRVLSFTMIFPKSFIHRLLLKIWFKTFYRLEQRQFVGQDKRLIESQNYRNPETLSATDIALIQWRKIAPKIARQPRFSTPSASPIH